MLVNTAIAEFHKAAVIRKLDNDIALDCQYVTCH
jgi:hypothetical protein